MRQWSLRSKIDIVRHDTRSNSYCLGDTETHLFTTKGDMSRFLLREEFLLGRPFSCMRTIIQ